VQVNGSQRPAVDLRPMEDLHVPLRVLDRAR
jgi:hypothetical protein